jgi:3-dehydrosphinganine reductase
MTRHALVTGGASGIGLALARRLLAAGAAVSVVDADDEGLQRLAAEVGDTRLATAQADVAERTALEAAVTACTEGRGPADLLVTCAGIVRPGRFGELDDHEFEREMAVNYFGTLWAIRSVAPAMTEAGNGTIVAISSLAGLLGYFGYSAYGPSKYAVAGLCETLRIELKPLGVHVACVYPPDVDTPMLAAEEPLQPPEARAMNRGGAPLSPDDVVDAILEGIAGRRARIYPGVTTRVVERAAHVAPSLLDHVVDRLVGLTPARAGAATAPGRRSHRARATRR